MAESDDELDIQRELDTRDSLASMARYHASSPSAITTPAGVAAKLHSHCDRACSPRDWCVSCNPVGRAGKAVAAWPFRSIRTFIGCGIAS